MVSGFIASLRLVLFLLSLASSGWATSAVALSPAAWRNFLHAGIATLGWLGQQVSVALGRAETGAGRRAQRRARRWLGVEERGPHFWGWRDSGASSWGGA